MKHSLLSLSSLIGAGFYNSDGSTIGVLHDVIGSKDSGKFTYFIVSVDVDFDSVLYAVHHSYFYLREPGGELTYSPKIGNDHVHFPPLPNRYDELDIGDQRAFRTYLKMHSVQASHRSDND